MNNPGSMERVSAVATLEIVGQIGILTIDSPPVNALGALVRQSIATGIEQVLGDANICAVILMCAGRTFFAGADISEFGKVTVQPDLNSVIRMIDSSRKLIVAALHGTALGGGLEVALACHARIAATTAKLGLPEVNLGLLPGAGGTQRLPRLIGVPAALDMMLTGKPVSAADAIRSRLIDEIADPQSLRESSLTFTQRLLSEARPLRRVSQLDDQVIAMRGKAEVIDQSRRRHAKLFKGFRAPAAIVQAVQGAIDLPFEQGMARERELFLTLVSSPESAAQRYAFFAEREATRVPGLSIDAPAREVQRVAVVGAGTMGTGIAINFLDVGLPVTLVEKQGAALDRGVASIQRHYETALSKGRLRAEDVHARLAILTPSLNLDDLRAEDLIVEAVFEDMSLKKTLFKQLDEIASADAILASNTSFLDLDEIAAATSRPERVVGLHFFSPANIMRLVEIVRGDKTAPAVVASAMRLARRIGKIAVVCGVCRGFIANRMMSRRSVQASSLILQGAMPWDVDRVICEFGFAMGPFAMMDLVGIDVVGWNRETSKGSTVQELLCEQGRWGLKRGAGYYDYDDQRRPTASPAVSTLIEEFSASKGIRREPISDALMLERLLYPVINEGAKILEEGIASRASDIDIALITGYGWPVYTGGPMYWAGAIGLSRIVESLKQFEGVHGEAFRPSALLEKLAARNMTFRDA